MGRLPVNGSAAFVQVCYCNCRHVRRPSILFSGTGKCSRLEYRSISCGLVIRTNLPFFQHRREWSGCRVNRNGPGASSKSEELMVAGRCFLASRTICYYTVTDHADHAIQKLTEGALVLSWALYSQVRVSSACSGRFGTTGSWVDGGSVDG